MSIANFIQANVWLVFIALVSAGVLLWPLLSGRMSSHKQVAPLQLVQLINRSHVVVIDVREETEFSAGHVVGAKHIPAAKLGERLSELNKSKTKPLVVVCQTGARSAASSALLSKNGFTDVAVLTGGLNAWQQANLPLEK
jgi:rhodanese-related sulfurtransferase